LFDLRVNTNILDRKLTSLFTKIASSEVNI